MTDATPSHHDDTAARPGAAADATADATADVTARPGAHAVGHGAGGDGADGDVERHAPETPQSEANPATASSTAYSVRIVAGILLIVVFGGLPTVVEGRPFWAAIVGLIGVIVGAVLVGMAVNTMIRERRARNFAAAPRRR